MTFMVEGLSESSRNFPALPSVRRRLAVFESGLGPSAENAISKHFSVRQAIVFSGEQKGCLNLESNSPQESGIMKRSTMSRMLQIGDRKVDEAQLADLCRRYRVRELSFFGSAARGEMRPDSDIDLLVEFLPDSEIDLVEYAGLMLELSHLLGRKVDLVSKNGLKPLIRASVIEEARLLYAA